MSADIPQFKLRIPHELKQWLRQKSKDNERSMSAHIIYVLKQKMTEEKASGSSLATFPDASHAE